MTSEDRISAADQTFHSRWKELGEDGLYPFERTYIALFWRFGDVFNGGFDNYFYNLSGDLALQAPDGPGQTGATNTRLIVADALDAFGKHVLANGCFRPRASAHQEAERATTSHRRRSAILR